MVFPLALLTRIAWTLDVHIPKWRSAISAIESREGARSCHIHHASAAPAQHGHESDEEADDARQDSENNLFAMVNLPPSPPTRMIISTKHSQYVKVREYETMQGLRHLRTVLILRSKA